ncbi:MAG: alpha-hydroxy-acid oxidizing protein [Eubacteriales bacterium]
MNLEDLRNNAREKMRPFCCVCQECDGKACAGKMPGMGGVGSGTSFKNNILALAEQKINLRTLHKADSPDTEFVFFNKTLSAPIMAAPITAIGMQTGGKLGDKQWAEDVVSACQSIGTIAWVGDGPDPIHFDTGIKAIKQFKGQGVPVIKPRENSKIIEYISRAAEAGATAIGIDIDAAGIIPMKLKGQPVGPKCREDLITIINSTTLPIILKGIMTSNEADLAAEVGAAGIVVSNHGGRVLDYTPGTAEVLPEIAERVSGRVMVIVDGGVRSGVDVLKMLALGADAVLIGRPLLIGAAGGGAEGITFILNKFIAELKTAMILTGCSSLKDISHEVLR